ncbi:hypothetical protein Pelo_5107 [Pelomyxa schiedti]|nr:hypothetical protein Pelo_5107 [Pelomyxa schiedti]
MQPTSSLPDWRTLFPNQLGPFHVVPAGVWFHSVIPDICAYELDVGRLLQSLQPFSPKDATGGSESPQIVSSLSRLQLLRRSGNSIRSMSSNTGVDSEAVGTVGSTSPWNALTTEHARVLPPHIRQRAASFAWCYPLPGFARLLASRGSSSGMCGSSGVPAEATADKIKNRKALRSESVLAFASVGGFVYTDVQGQVLYSVTIGKPNRSKHAASGSTGCTQTHPQAATSHLSGPNTSHKSYTTVMEFGAAHPWPLDLTDLLWKQGRFQPVSIKELFDGGARYFCWIRPSERVWSPSGQEYSSTWPNGAFAYLFGDDPFRDDPRNCCFPLQTVLQYPHPLFSQGTSPHHKVIKFSNFTVVPHSHSPYAIPPSQQQKDSPQFLHSPSTAPQQHLQTSPSSFHQTPPLLSQSSPLPPPYSPQVPPHVTSPPQTHLTTSSSGSTSPPPLQTSSSLETSGGLTDTMMRDLEVSVTICMACGIRRREAMCHPCLHFALCGECSLHCSSCPICHTHIANVVNLLS